MSTVWIHTERAEPCSTDICYHNSWDFAQNVRFPHNAQQVGPIHFCTPRKCHVFCMCAEGSGRTLTHQTSPGLDLCRQWYLYDTISPFFRAYNARDTGCPKPSMSKVKNQGLDSDSLLSKRKHSL